MNNLMVKSLFSLEHSLAGELLKTKTYPWEALKEIKDFILYIGATLSPDIYEKKGDDIWIAKSAKVAPSASITGPCIIGENTEVRHCAFIRGNALVGNGCVVGNSTEIKNSILFDSVQVPHYNYIGDSILGYKAHTGAGAITSNVKSDKTPVKIKCGEDVIETGLKKFGAMLGDNVEIGCGSVLNPGTVIGKNTSVYPLTALRGVYPSDCIVKATNVVVKRQ